MLFDLVIFDCDGVLVDSEPLVNGVEAELFTQLGVPMTPEESRVLFKGRTVGEIVSILEEKIGQRLSHEWVYDWGMATALGLVRGLRAVPGVQAIVAELSLRKHSICVASQSPPARVALSLALTGLDGFFGNRIYTASMVPRPKPAPDLFLHAAQSCGARPRACAVIEDSPSGVAAAVAAGMSAFGFAAREDASRLAAAGARVFHSMHELRKLLELGEE
jgi:HAD superfamily hydrolase (TIGR01509 family)